MSAALDTTAPLKTEPNRSVRAFVQHALATAAPDGVVAITLPAPLASTTALLRAWENDDPWLFRPASGPEVVTAGAEQVHQIQSGDRLEAAREATKDWLASATHLTYPDALSLPLRLWLGLSFGPGAGQDPVWSELGEGFLVLPRWSYLREGASASITLALAPSSARDLEHIELELGSIMATIERARGELEITSSVRVAQRAPVLRVEHLRRDAWDEAIASIRGAIRGGTAHKIVVSRRSEVRADTEIDPVQTLDRIAGSGLTHFFVRRGDTVFLGASPEHLFKKRGRLLQTEALAGSISAITDDAHRRLLESPKDREEHTYVIRHIEDRLRPLASKIEHSEQPEVCELPTVLHLRTPIRVELAHDVHPLDLIATLHPTPAVGGLPVSFAREWITEREPANRGWYSAPLGWFDAHGDADVIVSLRSGVIRNDTAWVYAGGGIVEQSDPQAEWEESELKMRPLLLALGARA